MSSARGTVSICFLRNSAANHPVENVVTTDNDDGVTVRVNAV